MIDVEKRKMSDRGKKDQTPPPLLLMPAGGGLTLNASAPNVLMPVVQAEASLFGPEEEGEVDSFLGQSPPSHQGPSQPATYNYFQQTSGNADPFAQVGQSPAMFPPREATPASTQSLPDPPGPSSSQLPGTGGPPPSSSAPPSAGPGANIYRQQGQKMRYAQPPTGTYASGSSPASYSQSPAPSGQYFQPQMGPPSSMSSGSYTGPPPQPPPPHSGPSTNPHVQAGAPGLGIYQPVPHHWCYNKMVDDKEVWYPFTLLDSMRLEEAYNTNEDRVVATDGGRYDVVLKQRQRRAIYWEEAPTAVRRCSWFYKREGDSRYVPYTEDFAQKLEEEYRNAVMNNIWHKRLEFPEGETIVMHNPNVIVHFQPSSQPDEWGNVQGDQMRPRVVKRGVDDFATIQDGEPPIIDHLVFVVHGIGPGCDMRFRSIVECVDDFRALSLTLLTSHFNQYQREGRIGRVEFLPVHWHSALHGDATGVDQRLKAITLPSTAKLRHFVNDTLLDILFYTSPTYCQTISDTVGKEMNRLFKQFQERNPTFKGTVSVAGHSLGSCILFDLLQQQTSHRNSVSPEPAPSPPEPQQTEVTPQVDGESSEDSSEPELSLEGLLERVGLQDKLSLFTEEQIDMEALEMCSDSDLKDLGLPMGPRKKLTGILAEEQQKKVRRKEAAAQKAEDERRRREVEEAAKKALEESAKQGQLCSSASATSSVSVEYLFGLAGTGQPFVKYPQLTFAPSSFFALGSPIGVFLAIRGIEEIGEEFRLPTCARVLNIFHPFDPVAYRLEPLVNPTFSTVKPVQMPHHKGRKRLHLELRESLTRVGADLKQRIVESVKSTWQSIHEFARSHTGTEIQVEQEVDNVLKEMAKAEEEKAETASIASSHDEEINMGVLNEGKRIDYVLQEKPIESFNDYLFALASHACYWESEDTVLMVLKEIYSPYGMTPSMPGPDGSKQPFAPPPNRAFAPPPKAGPPPYSQGSAPPHNHGPPPLNQGPPIPHTNNGYSGPPVTQTNVGPPPMAGFVRAKPQ